MKKNIVKAFLLPNGQRMERKTPGAAGFDLYVRNAVKLAFDNKVPYMRQSDDRISRSGDPDTFRIWSKSKAIFSFGVILEMPFGWYATVELRGGSLRHCVFNFATGIPIDCDFRGEFVAKIMNMGRKPLEIGCGERFFQLVFHNTGGVIPEIRWVKSYSSLSSTSRGNGCHSSTGNR